MANKLVKKSISYDVEAIRRAIFVRLAPPPDLLQKAFERLDEQLDAKKSEFFTFQGRVTDERLVEDNMARQGAIDKVMKVAGTYVQEQDKVKTPQVALRIDPVTGVLELVIGGDHAPELESRLNNEPTLNGDPAASELVASPEQLSLPHFMPSGHLEPAEGEIVEMEPQVFKMRNGKMPPHVIAELFKDEP